MEKPHGDPEKIKLSDLEKEYYHADNSISICRKMCLTMRHIFSYISHPNRKP